MMPVAALLVSLVSGILIAGLRRFRWSRPLSFVLSSLHLVVVSFVALRVFDSGPMSLQVGAWAAPFGISFYVDGLSAIMLWISSFLAFGVHLYSLGSNEADEDQAGFHLFIHFLMVGVCGAFSTNDLFNLFVWFEVLLISSFALLGTSAHKKMLSSSLVYVIINLLGSALFVLGLGLLYNSTGTLNFADLLLLKEKGPLPPTTQVVTALLIVAFAMKAGLVPFAQWLPSSYPAAGAAALALFAGLLTKVGVYTLMRFVAVGLGDTNPLFLPILTVASLATMLIGVLGAASSYSWRHILSYHIVSQVGYMALGLSMGTVGAMTAVIFYLVHHMIVKTSLFMVSGMIEKRYGSEQLVALHRKAPLLVIFFAIPALSLAGIPPLSGFWAKLLVLQEALHLGWWISALFVLVVGLLTLFSMSKLWSEVFQRAPEMNQAPPPLKAGSSFLMSAPLALFCLWILFLGLTPGPLVGLARIAAEQLLDHSKNISIVQPQVPGP
jgi:multicomponent Na+:H+ antiporter subunit D